MKKNFALIVFLFSFSHAFAQKDLVDRLEKQAIEIDSLKKLFKSEIDTRQLLRGQNASLQDTLQKLKNDFKKLEQFRRQKIIIDSINQQKTDSILLLKASILERDKQLVIESKKAEQKAIEENEKGKNEILALISVRYKSQPFDELLKSSTKQLVVQDLQLCQSLPEVKLILSDLQKYLGAKEFVNTKLDTTQIKNHLIQLNQIKRESVALAKLKEIMSNYKTVNNGLKETLERVVALDKETVSGISDEIQKKKLCKILGELTLFIFNYDFNYSDYPYLSSIIFDIIKRKRPNADADVSDLLERL